MNPLLRFIFPLIMGVHHYFRISHAIFQDMHAEKDPDHLSVGTELFGFCDYFANMGQI